MATNLEPPGARRGLVHASVDLFLDRTRALAELVGAAGSGVAGALPAPVPTTVTHLLSSMQQLAEQMPSITAELDVVVAEVHAKRLSIQALRAELAALDDQLDVLERSLAPVQAWSREWARVRRALTTSLRLPAAPGPGTTD